ncbi:Uma2 family endonuclease [Streptomyces sp. FH025]|uniref:Uma2 family endonuclease n=1 Tax=Streptomyces sp. FH025 TaxID=2815937 RepID=UPI001A9DAE1E|nr:Uma2 family endonuclease [Streptomyces sp. FH025]MBO1420269.1 Uma2 family endonuclease [Streptomyces sp. FH025]
MDITDSEILLELFLALETPEGLRAQLLDGDILIELPFDGYHCHLISSLTDQVYGKSAIDMQMSEHKGLRLVTGGHHPPNHVIPHATFVPDDLRLFQGAPPWMEPDGVAMVAEVTSNKPDQDRIAKRHCYARAGIPLYLLIDREKSQVSLFSKPHREEYTEVHLAAFGEPLALLAPFDFELDTKDFL